MLIADSRGGKTTSKDGRAYRWQYRWEDNIQGWTGLSLAVELGRQHPSLSLAVEVGRQNPRMDGLIADSRGGKTTSKLIADSRGGKTTSKDGRAYLWQ